jgi:hypothetical protein
MSEDKARICNFGPSFWWIIRGESEITYLHPDGIWRETTLDEKNTHSGLYSSREVAERILSLFPTS